MQKMDRRDYLHYIRRRSKSFAKGLSQYRGVSRTSNGKEWQARMGKGRDTESLYIGTFNTEEKAARAYDITVIKLKGSQAITNFGLDKYDIKSIEQNEMIPVGQGASKSLQRIPAKEILKRKTKDVKKPGALKIQEQSLVVPTNQNTQNIIPPPPQNPSYPQVFLDLQGADHGKIDAQNVPTLQEDQLFSGFLYPYPSSPAFYPHQIPDAQLEGIPREGSDSFDFLDETWNFD
ncbi:hypothetical protein UlMin_005888 [Ulmus minor]